MTSLSRRNKIRLISFSIFGLIVLFVLAINGAKTTTSYKNQLELSYQQSLTELDECLETVSTDLTKSIYSNSSGEIYDLSRDLYAQCATAKNAISRLPIRQMELGNAYKFLSQASDYAQYIGSKIENNEEISDTEHKNLITLLDYAQKFSKRTGEMVSIVESGGRITENEVKATEPISVSTLSNDFSLGAKTFEDFPTLLYDGPFSDQVLNKSSKMVKDARIYTREGCLKEAARALDVPTNKLSFESDEQGSMPCYSFNCGRYSISITKQGRYVREIMYSGTVDSKSISTKNACNLALDYLTKLGYGSMAISYYAIENNVCMINCAYKDNGVVVYSDLIKVGISMADGKLISLDSTTYLTNHTDRKIKKPRITESEAKKRVSKYLTPQSIKQCIIPKENGSEVQCYEVTCTSAETGEKALVYINTQNGDEEDIMLLIESDNGTLVK